jgi:DNA-binding NtrC family response regulator
MDSAKILIVGGNATLVTELRRLLEREGHTISLRSPGLDAEHSVSSVVYDLILIESSPGSAAGLDLLRMSKSLHPHTEVILFAEQGSVDEAVTAMRLGAFNYLTRGQQGGASGDLASQQQLTELHDQTLQGLARHRTIQESTSPSSSKTDIQKIIGKSPKMQEVKRAIVRVAPLDCTVVIRGETGTGKELISRTIHDMSPRSGQQFLAINCGALNEDLLRNELYGHEREAFTGAVKGKKGLFEAVSGGTMLLDEIGDMPLAMQSQLLRVLQEKTVTRIGGAREIPVDVRVLAATNRSLREEIAQGLFREDLFYRLSAFIIRMPPLRERPDDIPLFNRHFIDRYATEFGKPVKMVSDEVMSIFSRHPFPGNVRELENIIELAVVLAEGEVIEKRYLPQRFLAEMEEEPDASRRPVPTLAELEKQHILTVVSTTGGNKTRAAQLLGISRVSLWRRLKEYGLAGTAENGV